MSNKDKTDVLQGTLDVMILQTVATLGPMHGYAVAARLEQASKGALQLKVGTLYPGLLRLEQKLAHIRENLKTRGLEEEFDRAHEFKRTT